MNWDDFALGIWIGGVGGTALLALGVFIVASILAAWDGLKARVTALENRLDEGPTDQQGQVADAGPKRG